MSFMHLSARLLTTFKSFRNLVILYLLFWAHLYTLVIQLPVACSFSNKSHSLAQRKVSSEGMNVIRSRGANFGVTKERRSVGLRSLGQKIVLFGHCFAR